jgi:hypothetical protein
VPALGEAPLVLDALFFEYLDQGFVFPEKEVVLSAGDPEKIELFVRGFRISESSLDGIRPGNRATETADPCESVELVQPDREGMQAAHGETGDGTVFAARPDPVFILEHRENEFDEVPPQLLCVLRRAAVSVGFGNGMAVEHRDDHGPRLFPGDEVVEDPVGPAITRPARE